MPHQQGMLADAGTDELNGAAIPEQTNAEVPAYILYTGLPEFFSPMATTTPQ